MKDFYYILGTERNCTPGELNSAYRKLAEKFSNQESDDFLQHHFSEISEAYEVLSDPSRRRKYDVAFRKHYQRRLYYFKIRHLNVAVTLTLIFITGLFGWYVMDVLKGRPKKALPQAQAVVVPDQPIVKHHKRKHFGSVQQPARDLSVSNGYHPPVVSTSNNKTDTPVQAAHPMVRRSTSARESTPAASVKPEVNDDSTTPTNDGAPSAFLQANMTGVVALHQSANYGSTVIINIPNQAKITVLEHGPIFCKINYRGQIGYVPKRAVVEPF